MHVCGTGAVQLYIQLEPWRYNTEHIWSWSLVTFRDKHYRVWGAQFQYLQHCWVCHNNSSSPWAKVVYLYNLFIAHHATLMVHSTRLNLRSDAVAHLPMKFMGFSSTPTPWINAAI